MHKSYFSNLTAGFLSVFAVLLLGVIALFTDPIIEEELEIVVVNQGQDEFEDATADYVLLLPPSQEITASRAPLPDVDYRLPKNIDKFNYLAIGQDLTELLRSKNLKVKLQGEDAYLWSQAVLDVMDKESFKSPQRIMLIPGEAGQYLENIKVPLDAITYIEARRSGGGFVTAGEYVLPTHTKQRLVTAEIDRSFYDSAVKAGLPREYLEKIIYNYSFDVDFQRDIKKGDLFEILYETVATDTGRVVEYGDILFMNLVVNRKNGGKNREMFLHARQDSKQSYFDKSGISVEKSLLKTPVSGARLSSGFGYRRHPILGYNKLHQGVDFAAPTGTPIYAAGGGVVEYAGRFSSYGNYIRIRHGGKYKTVYAHLSRFAKGIKKGATVEQKQVIGYVGSTGRSTGPHLHYEILQGGKALNPSKLELPSNQRLEGEELLAYQEQYRYIKRLAYDLRNRTSVAVNGIANSEIVKDEQL